MFSWINNRLAWISFGLVALVVVLAYQPGLDGPFLFDDHTHIRLNTQVHIDDLSTASISQAWNSSLSPAPSNRPLAQLSFGINHVVDGLSTRSFKTTNLAIHLTNGILIFLLARTLLRALCFRIAAPVSNKTIDAFALTVSAIWLLHPLNLTPVLYIVQRMTSLSTLFVLSGLWLYVSGRLSIAQRQRGLWKILLAFPIGLTGILAKENAALFPVFVLVMEFTLLRGLEKQRLGKVITGIWIIWILLPILGGLSYLLTHPELYSYNGRSFTLEERLLTQARALGFYVQMFITPTLQDMALFHDDFTISRGWLTPVSTLAAVITWLVLLAFSLLYAKRLPVIAFGVLFFLAAHSLESSIFPLEMVFEHRNYLALLGPIFGLSYYLIVHPHRAPLDRLLPAAALVLVLAYAATTHLRAIDWASAESLTISEVRHHPESKRANFKAAQFFMRILKDPKLAPKAYAAARYHFETLTRLDPGHPDALFGLIILNMHIGRPPEPQWVDTLADQLANHAVDATRFTPSQFTYLVRWHLDDNPPLPENVLHRLFEAIASNPRLSKRGQAGILAARAVYLDRYLRQPELALPHARQAVAFWPTRWHYRKRLTQLLTRLQRWQEAEEVVNKGIRHSLPSNQLAEAKSLLASINKRQAISQD